MWTKEQITEAGRIGGIDHYDVVHLVSVLERDFPVKSKKRNDLVLVDTRVHNLQLYVKEHFENVSKLKKQLTFEQCETLVSKYDRQKIADTLLAMENKADLSKKYVSVYLTLSTWLKRDNSIASKPSKLDHNSNEVNKAISNLLNGNLNP